MKLRLYIPVFSITLLLSAALLFSVQPLFSKMVLPLLGGTPQVWNTAMLFFQLLLLAGYAYAHGTTKLLGVRTQAILHLALLAVFAFVLPIAIPDGWHPPAGEDPTFWQLSLMAVTVGGPFFILSGSAPMLQRWFSNTDHPDAGNPYFLYGASNLGSIAALLAYPVVIEPLMNLSEQSHSWTIGYIALGALTAIAAAFVWTNAKDSKANEQKAAKDDKSAEVITWGRRGQWLMLAFIPSSLMLGVTTYVTTDIASVPLLWIIPLALYVSTFIIVFARTPIISNERAQMILAYLLIALLVQMIMFSSREILLIPFHMVLFFFAALACHSELSAAKPHARHLTEFYLVMSIGGALGGVFNALIAPNLFIIPLEYAIALGGAACLRFATTKQDKPNLFYVSCAVLAVIATFVAFNVPGQMVRTFMAFIVLAGLALTLDKRWLFGLAVAACLLIYPPGHIWGKFIFTDLVHQDRNFFGVVKVFDTTENQRILLHGTTNHGTQSLEDEHKMVPLSYYHHNGSIADTFRAMDERNGTQKVAVLGLGIGVTACLGDADRHDFDFYEIDPEIVEIAENEDYFTFLSDCGSPYKIILGDARLTVADQPDALYDYMLVDVYSSDNIPVHLITREAIELYLQKLKPDGILAFNISNSYLDIEPVLAEASKALGIDGYSRVSEEGTIEGTEIKYYAAHSFAFARNDAQKAFLERNGWTPAMHRDGVKLWTDQYSNIISVIGNKTGSKRMVDILRAKEANEKNEETE